MIHAAIAFFFLVLFLAIGDIISEKTKALIPSLLVFLILLLTTTWSGLLPKNIIEAGGFSGQLTSMIIVVIVANMGSSLSFSDLKSEWRTVIIGVMAVAGVGVMVLTIGAAMYDWSYAVVAAPPISGGLVAAYEMSQAALQKNLPTLAAIAVLILSLQSIPAYLIIPTLLKREARRTLSIRASESVASKSILKQPKTKKRLIPPLPEMYRTTSVYLALLGLVALLAVYASQGSKMVFNEMGVNYSISATIFALFFGVIAREIGFLEPKTLQNANVFGFFIIASIIGVMGNLVNTTPEEILQVLAPIVVLILIAIVGIALFSIIMGRLLGRSWEMSFAIGLNCLLGFPLNFLLANEAINVVTKDDKEKDYLSNTIIPTMLVAGFVTVTIGSVIFAGVLKNFL